MTKKLGQSISHRCHRLHVDFITWWFDDSSLIMLHTYMYYEFTFYLICKGNLSIAESVLYQRIFIELIRTWHFKVSKRIGSVVVILFCIGRILGVHLILVPLSRFIGSSPQTSYWIFQVETQSEVKALSKYGQVDGCVENKVAVSSVSVGCQTKLEFDAELKSKPKRWDYSTIQLNIIEYNVNK